MYDDTNLTTLPPDIMRRIVRMEELSINEMRLISRSWNALVCEFTSNPRNLPTLERVYFFEGQSDEENDSNDDDSDSDSETSDQDDKKEGLVRMYALMPEKYSDRAGVGRWLEVFQKHSGDIVEVKSGPPHLCPTTADYQSLMQKKDETHANNMNGLFLCMGATIVSPIFGFFGLAALFALLLLAVCFKGHNENRPLQLPTITSNEQKCIGRFKRFFATFSHIETLVLEKLEKSHFDAVAKILGDERIDQLEIREFTLDEEIQERIMQLCRKYNIRHVLLSVFEFKKKIDFRTFVIDLARLGVRLDVYERTQSERRKYFRRTREKWDEMAKELSTIQISMRIATFHDVDFDNTDYDYYAKTHISCEMINEISNQPQPSLRPVKRSRGYNK